MVQITGFFSKNHNVIYITKINLKLSVFLQSLKSYIMKTLFPVITLFFTSIIFAQSSLLQSGPMVGYSTMKEALLWVQTTDEAEVYATYSSLSNNEIIYKTNTVHTSKDKGYVAHLIADELEPNQIYSYDIYINDQKIERPYPLKFQSQPLWKWRGDAPDFSFVTGSCAYINEPVYDRPGTPYGSDYQIFTHISNSQPNFMLWLGDNVYLREADWNSKTGILHRYTHTRSLPELQPLWGSVHQYGIWDDHDYGPNNSDRSYHMKDVTNDVFRLFFPSSNYTFDQGITSYFQWADCDFFLLDNRFWRSPNNRHDIENPTVLGEEQLQWLIDALSFSEATFKFVAMGGQFLNPLDEGEKYIHLAPEERQYIIDAIAKNKISGVIFLTGDVHHTELSKLTSEDTYPLYDLTVSPFTSGVSSWHANDNALQIPNTLVIDHTFAKMSISGPIKDRKLTISIINDDNQLQWQYEIKANDLKLD